MKDKETRYRIEPNEFKEAFMKVVKEEHNESELIKLWESKKEIGQKETPYTRFFLAPEDSILANVAKELQLQYCKEYWSLDAIFFESKDEEHFEPKTTFAESITVALEHESDAKKAVEETNKLAIINAPLRVLITYAEEGGRKDRLKEYEDIISKADIFNDFYSRRKFMVIFASLKKPQTIDWQFFLYKKEKLKEF